MDAKMPKNFRVYVSCVICDGGMECDCHDSLEGNVEQYIETHSVACGHKTFIVRVISKDM